MINILKKPSSILLITLLILSIILAVLAYRTAIRGMPLAQSSATATPVPAKATPTRRATNGLPAVEDPSRVLGIEGDPTTSYPGIAWVRVAYPTCGASRLQGSALKKAIQDYHKAGTRVLLTVCQRPNSNAQFFDTAPLNDAARGLADAVQCGNEQMKQDASVSFLYIPPERFARFYDMCERAVHAVRPEVPVLLGSLDPHVGGVDIQPLQRQVQYLNHMQQAMNTSVHPGGHWDWHAQILGLIDSWHNGWNNAGYADPNVNSLGALFSFWADQFHLDLNKGQLGEHLWVVEGTGCFKGCGIDTANAAQVATSHILTLVIDVQTAMKYKVPFFYFSGKDFQDQGLYWPIGVLDGRGLPKPLRQDLPMGLRSLQVSCSIGKITVVDQLQLLSRLYQRCSLPSNYLDTLAG